MAEAFPIFIGITGKRSFAAEAARAQALEARVRERLDAVFRHIDETAPDALKVLLTGAAAGTDLIAAERVLHGAADGGARPGWLVLAALPFEAKLFREDFDDPADWALFERVTGNPRTRTWTLPPLSNAAGRPATAEQLTRGNDPSEECRELRRRHYEQIGLWIADTANLLLAAMPDGETAGKVGGTARIVAYRRAGRPDRIAAEVIAASGVLSDREALLRSRAGYVWLLDPEAEVARASPSVSVLAPWRTGFSGDWAYEKPTAARPPARDGHEETPPATIGPEAQSLEASEAPLRIASRYLPAADGPRARLESWPEPDDPVSRLERFGLALRGPGSRASRRSRDAFYGLVGLFLVSVLSFEVYAKFLPKSALALAAYILFPAVIVATFVRARRREWQPLAEDLRAIREVLRVQRAWWRAGVEARGDEIYMAGADADLARVREAAGNLIAWALLAAAGRRPAVDWTKVFVPRSGMSGRRSDWVGEQCDYFAQRTHQRESRGQLAEVLSWVLFTTSIWLAAVLLAWLSSHALQDGLTHLALGVAATHPALAALAGLACVGAAGGIWAVSGTRRGDRDAWSNCRLSLQLGLPAAILLALAALFFDALTKTADAAIPLVLLGLIGAGYGAYWLLRMQPDANAADLPGTVAGLAAAVLSALVVQSGAAVVAGLESGTAIKYMMIVSVIFLPALAGGMRFLSEKLAVEAEALSYRDALVWFQLAEERLEALAPGSEPTGDTEAREIVRKLGILALGENEAWLKARRERPLAPVIGG